MFELAILHTDTLASTEQFNHALSLMPQHRREKILSYHFAKDQRLSLGAGLLLHRWLAEQGLSYTDIAIAQDAYGKPFFPEHPGLHFNLSHAGTYVVLATAEVPVGVDIEEIKPHYLDIAERFFTPEEVAQIKTCGTIRQQEALFFRLWTMKESYMKATGLGFQLPLHSFSIQAHDTQSTFRYPPQAKDFTLYEQTPPQGYALTVCLKNK